MPRRNFRRIAASPISSDSDYFPGTVAVDGGVHLVVHVQLITLIVVLQVVRLLQQQGSRPTYKL